MRDRQPLADHSRKAAPEEHQQFGAMPGIEAEVGALRGESIVPPSIGTLSDPASALIAASGSVSRARSAGWMKQAASLREVPLPLNLIAFPGAPPKAEWASAGVARISHGPFPHRALMAMLTDEARKAIA